ncbi:hypothetical protein QQP08_010547 [Theobroma cacao]|nr:hypothetical protein QQP08_010547 [Theobroma cacao]
MVLERLPILTRRVYSSTRLTGPFLASVWLNGKNKRRLISVNVLENTISIFDTGPGMDSSDENSIVKCFLKLEALFCDNAALFGHVWIWRTYGIYASRETDGGIRDASEDEIRNLLMRALQRGFVHVVNFFVPYFDLSDLLGCYSQVEILKPRQKNLDIFKLLCKPKDIYFPYIQCDELSNAGRTITPVEFQVQRLLKGQMLASSVFIFPYISLQGKENIERILEKLDAEGCGVGENYENFSCIPISCLGRLLPDARWCAVLLGGEPQDLIYNVPASLKALLPFMDLRQHKGDKSRLLKRCCLRVKCSVGSVQNL